MLRYIFNVFAICSCLVACNDSVQPFDPAAKGYDYYPLVSGSLRTYEVVEIIYNELGDHDTLLYQIEEEVGTSFSDVTGEETYPLKRRIRMNGDTIWTQSSNRATYRNDRQAVLVLGGIPVISLTFPVEDGRAWDSMILSAAPSDEYEIQQSGQPYEVGGQQYAETLTVIQEDKPDSVINFVFAAEVYARNVGLIEKVYSDLQFCQPNVCPGEQIVVEGRYLTQRLIGYEE